MLTADTALDHIGGMLGIPAGQRSPGTVVAAVLENVSLVDAEPVRAHVRALMATRVPIWSIAEQAGVDRSLISALLYGVKHRNIQPTKRVRPFTALALLSVQAPASASTPA